MYLIPEVLGHAKATHAKGTLIVPQWSSPPFWPKFFFTDSKVKQNVVATKLRKGKLLCAVEGQAIIYSQESQTLNSTVRLDFQ